jgi:uncharacterized protein (DUF433 family)
MSATKVPDDVMNRLDQLEENLHRIELTLEKLAASPFWETQTGHAHIERVRGVCGGDPVIVATRIPVWLVVSYVNAGSSVQDVLAAFPHLTVAQVYDALSYYYDHKDEIETAIAENSAEQAKKWLSDSSLPFISTKTSQ